MRTVFAGIAVLGLGISASQATLMDVTTTDLPNAKHAITIVAGGPLAEKTTSQGDSQLFAWLQGEVTEYNASHDPDLPAPLLPKLTGDMTSQSGIDFSGFVGDYVVVHWGNGQANKLFSPKPDGGFDQAFYIDAGNVSSFSFITPRLSSSDGTMDVGGLSFWRVYGGQPPPPVPDSGATLALLGGSIMALSGLRRRFVK